MPQDVAFMIKDAAEFQGINSIVYSTGLSTKYETLNSSVHTIDWISLTVKLNVFIFAKTFSTAFDIFYLIRI